MVQLSQPYMTIRKTIALTIQTFVDKVVPLLFNTLSRFVIVSMQSISCKIPAWMKLKLESRFPGEIPTTTDMKMIPL